MTVVGVAKLKASLSAYLAQVKSGRELIVTEHGRPIARLVPIRAEHADEEAHLADLERRGILRRGRGNLLEELAGMERPEDPEGLVLAALLEEREEGR
jgi:prevent-host-death family protein